jgi:hypothetical protein
MALMLQLLLKNPFKKSDGEDGADTQSEAAAFRRIWAAFLSGKRRLEGLSMGFFGAYPWSVKGRLEAGYMSIGQVRAVSRFLIWLELQRGLLVEAPD